MARILARARYLLRAQYLLRFDDLCPTVHKHRWERLVGIVREFQIRPILAVVPDNQDRGLMRSPADPGFWEQMRELEAAGAAIALHGLTHLCTQHGRNLIKLHRRSEFSGLPLEEQRQRIQMGLAILRGNGLNPRLWVAPRHGFDKTTLAALREEGIHYLSDGMARIPFLREGVVWIPQQIWEPVRRERGLWTICLHPNSVDNVQAQKLRAFLARNAADFTSFERVAAEFEPAGLSLAEKTYESFAMGRLRLHRARKQLFPTRRG
jgi:predicted deacetylase